MPLLRCECFGHASSISYVEGNATHPGHCVCNTEGETVSVFSLCLNYYEFNNYVFNFSGWFQETSMSRPRRLNIRRSKEGGGGLKFKMERGLVGGGTKKGHENG